MKIIAIIVARMDSSRLPGKVLKEVNNVPIIKHVISRGRKINFLDDMVLATTDRQVDLSLVRYAKAQGVKVFSGPKDDVALRMLQCAQTYQASHFIRINGDSPFLDPALITKGITYCSDSKIDLITNLIGRTFPYGVSVEIVKTDLFSTVYNSINSKLYREHPTKYLYDNIEKFNIHQISSEFPELKNARLVVDTEDDFKMFRYIVHSLGDRVWDADFREIAQINLVKGEIKSDNLI